MLWTPEPSAQTPVLFLRWLSTGVVSPCCFDLSVPHDRRRWWPAPFLVITYLFISFGRCPLKSSAPFLRSFFSLIITVELQEFIVYLGYWDLIRCVTGEFWSLLRFYEGKNGSNSFSMWRRFFMKKGLPRCCQGQLRSQDQISEVIQSQRN